MIDVVFMTNRYLFYFCAGIGPLQGLPTIYECRNNRVHEYVLGRVLRIVQKRIGQ